MKFLILFSILLKLVTFGEVQGKFQVAYQWKNFNFNSLSTQQRANFNDTHPVPFGIGRHNNRMFIGLARRNTAIPITLAYFQVNDKSQSPLLTPYPSPQANTVNPQSAADPTRIVSVYRPRVDECDRLWFVDTGVLEYPNNRIVVQRPSIWIMNLRDDSLIRRYEIPSNVFESKDGEGRGLVSMTIDDPHGTCTDAFAYLTDWLNGRLTVYSMTQNKAWSIDHNFFHFDPLYGEFNVGGFQFMRRDRLFSIALSHRLSDGSKIAFFHSMVSDAEFVVSTDVLRNETLMMRTFHGRDFKLLGHRGGSRNQAGIHVFDSKTRVMFTTMLQRNAVDCWRFDLAFSDGLMDTVDQNDELLYYPVDIILDKESNLWVLANKMPQVIYGHLDFSQNNFYILKAKPRDLIRGTKCDLRDGIKDDDCIKIFDNQV